MKPIESSTVDKNDTVWQLSMGFVFLHYFRVPDEALMHIDSATMKKKKEEKLFSITSHTSHKD
jgi:hypothetical protein